MDVAAHLEHASHFEAWSIWALYAIAWIVVLWWEGELW